MSKFEASYEIVKKWRK